MAVYVVAKDKKDELKPCVVEELATYDAARTVKEYVQQRVDADKWAIDTAYSSVGMPPWNYGNLRESPNAPGEDAP